MAKRNWEEDVYGERVVNCENPKEELAKQIESLDKIPEDQRKRVRNTCVYLLKEAYPILYIVQFQNEEHGLICVFSTKADLDEFIAVTRTMKPAIPRKIYAVSGGRDMNGLLKAAGYGMPSRIDDGDYYVMQLIKLYKAEFEFTGDANSFLAEIRCTRTGKLTAIERCYLDQIKKSFNKEFEKIK